MCKDNGMRPRNVWVVYGGDSSEREVSVSSGKNIAAALRAKGFEVTDHELKAHADLLGLFHAGKPDLVFLGFHGTYGEDGRAQGFLDTIGVPYVGSGVLASALCFNKAVTQRLLKEYDCPIAKFFERNKSDFSVADLLLEESEFFKKKWFIKAASQGSTIGVFRYDPKNFNDAEKQNAFEDFCAKAFQFDNEIIIEQWIEGRELTCAVVGGEAYPLVEIKPNSRFYDYQSKYTAGQTEYICPALVDPATAKKIQVVCEKIFKYLRCQDYARMDIMLADDGNFFILETNTLPGMTNTSLVPKAAKAKGLSFEDFIEKLVVDSYVRQGKA